MAMDGLSFDWDPRKDRANSKKHGVSFEEAKTVFSDDSARLIDDPEHSEDEDRFILLGYSVKLRLLIVCHCDCGGKGQVRIISARKANRRERRMYQELIDA
jgi:uncharacterized protein